MRCGIILSAVFWEDGREARGKLQGNCIQRVAWQKRAATDSTVKAERSEIAMI